MKIGKTNKIKEESSNKKEFKNNSNANKNTISQFDKYPYLKIDSSSIFKKITADEIKSINSRIEKYKNKEKNVSRKEFINDIMKIFLEKHFPKNEMHTSKIISLISNHIKSKKKLNRETMEEYIDFFYNQRDHFKSATKIVLDRKLFRNIGIVLSYVHFKLKDYAIDSNGIKEYINKIIINKINILTDYFMYCNNEGVDPIFQKKAHEWRKLVKLNNYKVPPELIFLINLFQRCLVLEININFDGEILNKEDLLLYTMTLLNLEYVFPTLEKISLNLVHNSFQKFTNDRYTRKLSNLIDKKEETLKKNYTKDDISLYEIKWDFEQEFNLSYFNELRKNSKKSNKKPALVDDYCIINKFEEKEKDLSIHSSSILPKKTTMNFVNPISEKRNKAEDSGFVDLEWDEMDKDIESVKTNSSSVIIKMPKHSIKNEIKEETKTKFYCYLSEKNSLVVEIMLMTFFCFSKNDIVRKLNILSNEFYSKSIIDYIKKFLDYDIKRPFHLFDVLINNKENGYETLNTELNSLDIFSFKKYLELISVNVDLISINISFFSSDISYLTSSLFEIYLEQMKTLNDINDYITKKGKYFNIEDFEQTIIDTISTYFYDNLAMLFEVIKNKKDLKDLGLNFDLPTILINNNNYKISIFKFILNIIMLIDNNESKRISNIKKLTLLSPKIIFNRKKEDNIDNFFKNISLNKTAKTLINLNIEFQFYNISYLKNIISTNLFNLNIGDLDLYTFEKLVQYLTSYNFSSKSNLSHLGIKLLPMITNFNTKLRLILQRLFNINLRNLLDINLFTNLIIDKKANYLFLTKLLQNNWISSYIITLNEKSKKIVDFFHIFGAGKILYLVSESIQNLIFKDSGFNIIRRNNFYCSEVYWILKYIFLSKHKNNSTYFGYFEIQYFIFTILKYLFFTSNVKLEHKFHSGKK